MIGIVKKLIECKPEELDKRIEEYIKAGWNLYEKFEEPVYISGRGLVVSFSVTNV